MASVNIIEYVSIATTGNTTDFGDTTATTVGAPQTSNHVIGLIGIHSTGNVNYITIATTGNGANFGNSGGTYEGSGFGGATRGVHCGAYGNDMTYFTYATAGNGSDFGDMSGQIRQRAGCSDTEGGLGG